jgi:hypothetical protein
MLVLTFFSFQRLPDGELCALFLCVGVQREENDNDAHGSIRGCLAEPETTSTAATLGADQARFRNSSLSGSGIGFEPRGIVLGDYI